MVSVHLAVGPTGHRRRRWHERLRHRDRPTTRPTWGRRRHLHPPHDRRRGRRRRGRAGPAGPAHRGRALRRPVKEDLPGQLCAFAAGMMRVAARSRRTGTTSSTRTTGCPGRSAGWYADRWNVPSCTMRTMARVKNQHLAPGDVPEPGGREIGEAQVVEAATALVANTAQEARELVTLYGADPHRVAVAEPGVDLDVFTPGDQGAARGSARRFRRRHPPALRRAHPATQGPRPRGARDRRTLASAPGGADDSPWPFSAGRVVSGA